MALNLSLITLFYSIGAFQFGMYKYFFPHCAARCIPNSVERCLMGRSTGAELHTSHVLRAPYFLRLMCSTFSIINLEWEFIWNSLWREFFCENFYEEQRKPAGIKIHRGSVPAASPTPHSSLVWKFKREYSNRENIIQTMFIFHIGHSVIERRLTEEEREIEPKVTESVRGCVLFSGVGGRVLFIAS